MFFALTEVLGQNHRYNLMYERVFNAVRVIVKFQCGGMNYVEER